MCPYKSTHTIPDAALCIGGIFMNQETTPPIVVANTDTSIQCKSVFLDILHRFLTSGICIEYNMTTHVIRKTPNGTWQSADADDQEKNAMSKQGKLQIGYPDLVAGVLAIYALSAFCLVTKRIKRMLK